MPNKHTVEELILQKQIELRELVASGLSGSKPLDDLLETSLQEAVSLAKQQERERILEKLNELKDENHHFYCNECNTELILDDLTKLIKEEI